MRINSLENHDYNISPGIISSIFSNTLRLTLFDSNSTVKIRRKKGRSKSQVSVRLHASRMCVCVCVFSSHSFWTSSSLDVPAGVTQEEGHTGFLIHLLSAVRAFIFLARRIQPFLSLVDRGVEFCVLTIKSFSTRWAFLFSFLVF